MEYILQDKMMMTYLPNRFEKQLNILCNSHYKVCIARAIVKNTKKQFLYYFHLPTKLILISKTHLFMEQ